MNHSQRSPGQSFERADSGEDLIAHRQASYRNGRWRMQTALYSADPAIRNFEAQRRMQALGLVEQATQPATHQSTVPVVESPVATDVPAAELPDTQTTSDDPIERGRQQVADAYEEAA